MSACNVCCHWALPCTLNERQLHGVRVPLLFEEWIAYHLHVVTHQGGLKIETVDLVRLFPVS